MAIRTMAASSFVHYGGLLLFVVLLAALDVVTSGCGQNQDVTSTKAGMSLKPEDRNGESGGALLRLSGSPPQGQTTFGLKTDPPCGQNCDEVTWELTSVTPGLKVEPQSSEPGRINFKITPTGNGPTQPGQVCMTGRYTIKQPGTVLFDVKGYNYCFPVTPVR